MSITQTIKFTDPPFACPADKVIQVDLPPPISVNETRRINWDTHRKLKRWRRQADLGILASGGWKRLGQIPGKFEITITIDEHQCKVDADNAAKILIDYCRVIELITDDSPKYMRRVVIEFGYAPKGCRVKLREFAC